MAKRKRAINVEKLIKEGRGIGHGIEYKPWITIQDVPSLGRVTRLKGIKTQRQHEFLSDLEKNYFYFLEYSDGVMDIREQYPLLPLEETIMIAEELGVKHPTHPETGENIVMTTDFLITNNNNMVDIARTIKPQDELLNRRIIEKFEIERQYWKRKNVDWGIVTEKEINKTIAQNISYVHSYYDITKLDSFENIKHKDLEDLILEYTRRIIDTNESIRAVSKVFDEDMALASGSGISIFKYLIARKLIQIDLSNVLNVDKKINIKLSEKDLSMELKVL